MVSKNPLTEKLRPYVKQLLAEADRRPNGEAAQVIALYNMHVSCYRDPGAYAFCNAAFDEWKAHHDKR